MSFRTEAWHQQYPTPLVRVVVEGCKDANPQIHAIDQVMGHQTPNQESPQSNVSESHRGCSETPHCSSEQ